ncbi:alpha/beta fold hydrolase [Sporobolomyces salmoneus]|uniref:alpha/beta fold hydrolase n=1 Tax=Sporobolomyces salmoneus TaxID=183962 RepID=UPI00317D72AA
MPVTSYFPPDHDRPPPIPVSPVSPSSRRTRSTTTTTPSVGNASASYFFSSNPSTTLSRSTSEQLSVATLDGGLERPALMHDRRRSSALDEKAIRELSARAKEAELRAQWEGTARSRLLNMMPEEEGPSTPTRRTRGRTRSDSTNQSEKSVYETPLHSTNTPTSTRLPQRSPRSPRSRDHSGGGYAGSIRSNFSTTSSEASNLSAVSEFLAEEEPPPTTSRYSRTSPSPRISTSSSSSSARPRNSPIFPPTSNHNSRPSSFISPRSSFDSSSDEEEAEEEEEEEEEHQPISSTFSGPRIVKNEDQFVRVLNQEKQTLLEQRRRQTQARSGGGGGNSRDREGEREREKSETDSHSRSESGNSDASFASMTAQGPPPPAPLPTSTPSLAIAGVGPKNEGREEEELFGMMRRGGEGASSMGMERDNTLKASLGNRWDQGAGVKSMEEIIRGYKALGVGNEVKGIVERRRSSVATIQPPPSPSINRRDTSLDEYQYHTPIDTTNSTSNPLPYVPFPTSSNSPTSSTAGSILSAPNKIKTIEEIIAQHAGNQYQSLTSLRKTPSPSPSIVSPISSTFNPSIKTTRTRELSNISSVGSEDSVIREVRESIRTRENSVTSSIQGRTMTPTLTFDSTTPPAVPSTRYSSSIRSLSLTSPSSRSNSPKPPQLDFPSPPLATTPTLTTTNASQELSLLLKSPRLTRLIPLSRPPNASLTVSLSDVGSPTGHPVLIFLGLGSVRYLLALFDELAQALGLRLICIDRWGLGKTTNVSDLSKRGFREWSKVVEEVMEDHLNLKSYSVVGHSAGCPYTVQHALNSNRAVRGTIHLLAPWVVGGSQELAGGGGGMNADNLAGMYKYLKYVPSGVLKTAQTAEWKIQGWRLGKAPTSDNSTMNSPLGPPPPRYEEGPVAQEDDYSTTPVKKRDSGSLSQLGIVGNGDVVEKLEKMYPDGGIRLAGPHLKNNLNSTPRRKGSLSVNSKSIFGGIFANGGGGGGSAKSTRSFSGDSDGASPSSLRPSLATTPGGGGGRRSSYFAASAIKDSPSTTPIFESLSSSSGLTLPATPTSIGSDERHSFLSERSLSPISTTPLQHRSSSPTPSSPSLVPPSSATRSSISPDLLISGLLRASHAESLSGSTSDLLVLLDRSNQKSNTIKYNEVEQKVKVWYGDKDDRISRESIRWLEKEIKGCEVEIVKGADHNLMTNHQVMFKVLESISKEFDAARYVQ